MESLTFPPQPETSAMPTSVPATRSGVPRKLRTSCDGCHSAKVRCTKDKPACTRCMSVGYCCIYSPSLRAGKLRQTSRDSETESSIRNELDIAGLHWDLNPTGPEISQNVSELGDFSFASGQDCFKGFGDFQEDCNAFWQDAVGSPTPCIPDDQSGSLLDSDPQSLGSLHPSSSPLLTSSASSINLSSFLHDDADLSGLLPRSLSDIDVKRVGSAKDSTQQQNHQPYPAEPVELFPLCPQLSYTGIKQKKPTSESAAWSSTRCFSSLVHALHTLQRQTDTAATTLDVVLATSKEAVGWCDAVLRCACASDSTVIMLLAALVGKILTLYQSSYDSRNTTTITAGTADDKMDPIMEFEGPSSSSGRRGSLKLTVATAFHGQKHGADTDGDGGGGHTDSPSKKRSSPMRVTLGAYRLDGEDEGRLKVELMLIELRKVDGLLIRFRKRVGMVSVKHESRTYENLAMSLAKTLRATAERLQKNVSQYV